MPQQAQKKFYELSLPERLEDAARQSGVPLETLKPLTGDGGLTAEQADHMVENAIGVFGLPLGIARNFLINGKEYLIPMAIEEPSVVAGASFMAKLVRAGGGFTAESDAPEMIGQMQLLDVQDFDKTRALLQEHKAELLELAAGIDPVLSRFGGGPRDLVIRIIEDSAIGAFLVLHLIYDVRDAMGANAVNTALERLAPRVAEITGGRVHLRILSNLADRRLARAALHHPAGRAGFR